MKVHVSVEDATFVVQCAHGQQQIGWLASAACVRYCMGRGHLHMNQYTPLGVLQGDAVLDPTQTICERLSDDDHVEVKIGASPLSFTLPWTGRPALPTARRRSRSAPRVQVVSPEVEAEAAEWVDETEFKQIGCDRLILNSLNNLEPEQALDLCLQHRARLKRMDVRAVRCTSAFANEAAEAHEEDLALRPGDVVVLDDVPATAWWWTGSCGDRTGVFPSHYVEPSTTHHKNHCVAVCGMEMPALVRAGLDGADDAPATGAGAAADTAGGDEGEDAEEPGEEQDESDAPAREEPVLAPLAFGVGDTVVVSERRGPRWYCGTHVGTGRRGLFPPDCCEPAAALAALRGFGERKVQVHAARREAAGGGGGNSSGVPSLEERMAQLGHESDGSADGEGGAADADAGLRTVAVAPRGHPRLLAAVSEGDTVTVLDESPPGAPVYLRGRVAGGGGDDREGLFPSICVEDMPGAAPADEEKEEEEEEEEAEPTCRALCDYTPAVEGELRLTRGDVVVVTDRSPAAPGGGIAAENWWLGRTDDGSAGFFSPAHCVVRPPFNEDDLREDEDDAGDAAAPATPSAASVDAGGGEERRERRGRGAGGLPAEQVAAAKAAERARHPVTELTPAQLRDEMYAIESAACKRALQPHAVFVRFLYDYSCQTETEGSAAAAEPGLTCGQFVEMCTAGRIAVGGLKAQDAESIFTLAQSRGQEKKSKMQKDTDKTMEVDEFLAGVVRLAHHKYRDMAMLSDKLGYFLRFDLVPRALPWFHRMLVGAESVQNEQMGAVFKKHAPLMQRLFAKCVAEHVIEGLTLDYAAFSETAKRWRLVGATLSDEALRAAFLYVATVFNKRSGDVPDLDYDRFCQATAFTARALHDNPQTAFHSYFDAFLKRNVYAVEFADDAEAGVLGTIQPKAAEKKKKRKKKKGKK